MNPESASLPFTRSDTLPEGTKFADDGCDVSPSCLECPLAKCKHDSSPWLQDITARNARVFELRKQGVPIAELGRAFNLSSRSVWRIVQKGGVMKILAQPHNEPPKTDPDDLEPNRFKLYNVNGPAFRLRNRILIYRAKCRFCSGSVKVDLDERSAVCLSCGRDVVRKKVTA